MFGYDEDQYFEILFCKQRNDIVLPWTFPKFHHGDMVILMPMLSILSSSFICFVGRNCSVIFRHNADVELKNSVRFIDKHVFERFHRGTSLKISSRTSKGFRFKEHALYKILASTKWANDWSIAKNTHCLTY